jgi:hypothetical protein
MVESRKRPPESGLGQADASTLPDARFVFRSGICSARHFGAGTIPWLLGRHRVELFPPWLLHGWRGGGRRGRPAWPAEVLMTLVLLRWSEEGVSRLGTVKRAESDVRWRAALGLELNGCTPCEKTLRHFEAFLRAPHPACDRPRYLVFFANTVSGCAWTTRFWRVTRCGPWTAPRCGVTARSRTRSVCWAMG